MVAYSGFSKFRNAPIICQECGWRGQARQMQADEMFKAGVVLTEYHCPKCGEYISGRAVVVELR
jgi:predicted RNA-binding Zn-ribbon protein involved in translation (DUF1610 family)